MKATVAMVAAAGLLGLAGCTGQPYAVSGADDQLARYYAANLQDQPFDERGTVFVVAEERGKMRSFALTPCRGGTHICGTRAGHLARTPDFSVVSDAWPGRTFYLSPGGDGYLKRHGTLIPLAWNEGPVGG